MNAYMNINVRVISAAAQAQIRALQAQVKGLQGQLATANAVAASPTGIAGSRGRKSMMAWGNQIQWTGRQLQYNWTLPLLLAGGAAVKFQLDHEKAFTRVQKVYGDTDATVNHFLKNQDQIPEGMTAVQAASQATRNELNALKTSFEVMSSRYGVNQTQVLETASAWAAAGASGAALAKSTELSIRASILGDMDLAKSTQALIAIQAQYTLSTEQLGLTLAELNAIENQTGAQMSDLITGFEKSAGVAREAGIDVRHLGAMMAALVPATGSASTAGQGLKTIISRLLTPTGEAARVMAEFGVNTSDAAWQSSNAIERLTILAGHMDNTLKKTGESTSKLADDGYKLSDSQRQVVGTVLGSRYQLNRFLVLMREMAPEASYYEAALDATSDKQKVFASATKELNAVLESNPQKLKIIWTTMQNGMATAVQPLIPYILYLAQSVGQLVEKFSSLDPGMQKFILVAVVMLAAVGPLVRYFGSLFTLIGALALPFVAVTKKLAAFGVVTKVVNGQAITTRRSIIGMAISMLALPFTYVFAGFGRLIGILVAVAASFFRIPRIAAASAAATGGAAAIMSAAWATASAAVVATYSAAMTAIAFVSAVGFKRAARVGLLNMALVARGSIVAGGVVSGAFTAMSVAMPLLFAKGVAGVVFLFEALLGSMIVLGSSMTKIWFGVWTQLQFIMMGAQVKILMFFRLFTVSMMTPWASMYMGMVAASSAAWTFILRMYGYYLLALNKVVASAGLVTTRVWAGMHAAMALISRTFWTAIIRMWIVGVMALPRLLLGLRALGPKIFRSMAFAITTVIQKFGLRFLGIWGLIISVVGGLIYKFRDEIAQVWQNIVAYFSDSSDAMTATVLSAWNALPQGITNALIAVVRVVREAALAVYGWFSYINPFARHSPSLVENVTAGMKVVGDQFAGMRKTVGGNVRAAYAEIKKFGQATRGLMANSQQAEINEQRGNVKKRAPGALDEFNALASRLGKLRKELAPMQSQLDSQQQKVDEWARALDEVNSRLDTQQKFLDRAKDKLAEYTSSPIAGMGAMSDAIFDNEIAQKRLRLEMMKMSDAGQSFDDIKSKIDAINGAQELLSGQRESLRAGGAGSDILSVYDAEISALERQKKQHESAAGAISDMSTELARLERVGERLDLENSLAFDPLTRQIEKASSTLKEMPFDQIMAGVKSARTEIDKYQPVVDSLVATRDRMQDSMDREQDKLESIKRSYDRVADAISAVEQAMQSASQASSTLDSQAAAAATKKAGAKGGAGEGAVSPAVKNFRDAAGGNFAQVGGAGIPVRTDWSDQTKLIEEETARMADAAGKAFGSINPFGGIKKKWGEFKGWMKSKWDELKVGFADLGSKMFDGTGSSFNDTVAKFRSAWEGTKDWFDKYVIQPLVTLWALFGPTIMELGRSIRNGFVKMWEQVGPEFGKLVDEFRKMGPALKTVWTIVKVLVGVFGVIAGIIIYLAVNVLAKTLTPILKWIGDMFEAVTQIVRGVIQIFSGFFMLFQPGEFKAGLKKMLAGVWNIFGGLMSGIGQTIWAGAKVIFGFFWGIVDGIIDAAKWLYDVMVGHSIIPDLIDAIVWWFKSLVKIVKWIWNNVVMPVVGVFKTLFSLLVGGLKLWWAGMQLAWAGLKIAASWLWENVLKSIWNVFKAVWDNFIWPGLQFWWTAAKAAWSGLKTAASWLWNNVLKPIWDRFKAVWDRWIKPALSRWWSGMKVIWGALKAAGKWVWDNVLVPLYNRFVNAWNRLRGELGKWWGRLKSVWDNLKGIGTWFKTNVMDKVFNAVTGAWTRIKNWLTDNKDTILKPMKGIVNGIISAVNTVIKGLNKVSDLLPGVSWDINLIPKLANGGEMGRKATRGFRTNGARAIVGEGKANYPEYVIPTDPTYRHRAKGLLAQAAARLGYNNGVTPNGVMGDTAKDMAAVAARNAAVARGAMPEYAIGGWLGDTVKGAASSVKNAFGDLKKNAVSSLANPILDKADRTISRIGWDPAEAPPRFGIEKLRKWVTETNKSTNKAKDEAGGGPRVRAALAWARTQQGKPYMWGSAGPDGYDCSGFMAAITNYLRFGRPIHSRLGSTATFPWAGFKGGSQPKGFTIGSTPNYGGSGIGHMAGTLGGVNVESRGGQGVVIGSAARGYNSAGFSQSAYLPMKEGGIALRRKGGVVANIAEGRYDEAVVPLPYGWRNDDLIGNSRSTGDTYINVDKVVLPNITSGDDVEELIENLKLVGG